MINYEKYMKKCIALAQKSEGKVSPNPLVGAVILDANGAEVGYGSHEFFGEAHAEVNALKTAGEKALNGTIIVNLEPCSHYGKTPPCADLIIEKGLKKVVIGMTDPNPIVSGNGIKKLKDSGIEVIEHILEDECKKLNEIFIKNQVEKKPFLALKTATTLDGKIASRKGDSKWITNEESRAFVHKLRNKYDAILTGSATVLKDNPKMNCRIENGRNPVRIVVDTNLKCPSYFNFFNNDGVGVYCAVNEKIPRERLKDFGDNVEFIFCPLKNEKIDLCYLTDELYKKGIMSILVEAGGTLNGAFLKEKLIDKVYHFTAPKILGDKDAKNWVEGLTSDFIESALILKTDSLRRFGDDILTVYYCG